MNFYSLLFAFMSCTVVATREHLCLCVPARAWASVCLPASVRVRIYTCRIPSPVLETGTLEESMLIIIVGLVACPSSFCLHACVWNLCARWWTSFATVYYAVPTRHAQDVAVIDLLQAREGRCCCAWHAGPIPRSALLTSNHIGVRVCDAKSLSPKA